MIANDIIWATAALSTLGVIIRAWSLPEATASASCAQSGRDHPATRRSPQDVAEVRRRSGERLCGGAGARAVRRDRPVTRGVTRAAQKLGPLQRFEFERLAGTLLEAKL